MRKEYGKIVCGYAGILRSLCFNCMCSLAWGISQLDFLLCIKVGLFVMFMAGTAMVTMHVCYTICGTIDVIGSNVSTLASLAGWIGPFFNLFGFYGVSNEAPTASTFNDNTVEVLNTLNIQQPLGQQRLWCRYSKPWGLLGSFGTMDQWGFQWP